MRRMVSWPQGQAQTGLHVKERYGAILKLLADDGQGFWLCTKRLSQGRFHWWPTTASQSVTLSAWELQAA